MWFPWRQIKVILQTNAGFFLLLQILQLSLVVSDVHFTLLHKLCVPFLHGSPAGAGKHSAVRHPQGLHKDMQWKVRTHTHYENILLAKLYSILSRLNEAVRSSSLFCPNHQFYCCSSRGSLYPNFSPNRDNEYKQQPQTEAAQNRTKMHVQAHFYGRKNILTLPVLIGMY